MEYLIYVHCVKKENTVPNHKDNIERIHTSFKVKAETLNEAKEKAIDMFHEENPLSYPENYDIWADDRFEEIK